MRRVLLCLCCLVAAVTIAGCGGHSSHSISTGGSGDLRGLRTIPEDGERDVDVYETIRVYWVAGYEPPPSFKFALRDRAGNKILTVKKSSDVPNEWRFEPYAPLEYDSRYTIEVTYGGSNPRFVFWTEEDRILMQAGDAAPAEGPDPGDSEPLPEHTVDTLR